MVSAIQTKEVLWSSSSAAPDQQAAACHSNVGPSPLVLSSTQQGVLGTQPAHESFVKWLWSP